MWSNKRLAKGDHRFPWSVGCGPAAQDAVGARAQVQLVSARTPRSPPAELPPACVAARGFSFPGAGRCICPCKVLAGLILQPGLVPLVAALPSSRVTAPRKFGVACTLQRVLRCLPRIKVRRRTGAPRHSLVTSLHAEYRAWFFSAGHLTRRSPVWLSTTQTPASQLTYGIVGQELKCLAKVEMNDRRLSSPIHKPSNLITESIRLVRPDLPVVNPC